MYAWLDEEDEMLKRQFCKDRDCGHSAKVHAYGFDNRLEGCRDCGCLRFVRRRNLRRWLQDLFGNAA